MGDSEKTTTNGSRTGESPRRWFVRGAAAGMLLMAAVNAVSYFFRSAKWGSLVGKPEPLLESVGFPLKVWEAGNTYGGFFADYPRLGVNILVAAGVGVIVGMIAAGHHDFLNRVTAIAEPGGESQKPQPIQFSLRGLMVATTIAAVVAMLASKLVAHPGTLLAIYALGPVTLVAIAMIPRRLSWRRRVAIIIPTTLTLIAVAVVVGNALEIEFDKVLLGIFLCWTPQSALAAVVLTASILMTQPSA